SRTRAGGDETTQCTDSPVRVRISFRGPVQACDGTNRAIARISGGSDGTGSRMARKPSARAEIGTGTRAAEQQGAERNLLAAGALRARVPQTVSREKCIARPRHEF